MLNSNELARIVADSFNVSTETRMTSFLIKIPKNLLAQLNTHRMLVRNCASSRAIPTHKLIEPLYNRRTMQIWTKNQRGMSGIEDAYTEAEINDLEYLYYKHLVTSTELVEELSEKHQVHKQQVNRFIEPFMEIEVLISGTEWRHFFSLRTKPDVQPEFRRIAVEMELLYNQSPPTKIEPGQWHMVFSDLIDPKVDRESALKIATARAARLSYATHDGEFSVEKDIELADRLFESRHYSCFEHCALAVHKLPHVYDSFFAESLKPFIFMETSEGSRGHIQFTRNYAGFYSYRSQLEDANV